MKRRRMRGVPAQKVKFGECDPNPFAPLHRRMGISTFVHRQAILNDCNERFGTPRYLLSFDPVNRVHSRNHIYRASITLPAV